MECFEEYIKLFQENAKAAAGDYRPFIFVIVVSALSAATYWDSAPHFNGGSKRPPLFRGCR